LPTIQQRKWSPFGRTPLIRVGVDAWNVPHDRRGIGRYVREMVKCLRDEHASDVACTLVIPEWATWIAGKHYLREIGGALPVASRRAARQRRFDLLWFPFNGPSWDDFRGPSVATLHDALNFALPGFSDETRAPFRRAAERCERIVTDSEFSRSELLRVLPLEPERISVVLPGVAPLPTGTPSLDVAALGTYLLFVGETDARKGIDTFVAAAELLRSQGRDVTCVIAGRIVGELPAADGLNVRALGFVDDVTLQALYHGCRAFVFPSRYEGFGLPILEAMLAGAPVVASAGSSLIEAGGDAALYAPPDDVAAFADAVGRIFNDDALAATLRRRGVERARSMTWSRAAGALVDVFRQIA
jgi:glycosyltransferase involved in cell wall biosynthesis